MFYLIILRELIVTIFEKKPKLLLNSPYLMNVDKILGQTRKEFWPCPESKPFGQVS